MEKERICPKCLIKHEKDGIFCSTSCANKNQIWSEERRKRISDKMKIYHNSLTAEQKQLLSQKRKEGLQNWKAGKIKQKIFSQGKDLEKCVDTGWIKQRLLMERGKCCEKCQLDSWMGEPITIELEHIDGNSKNNLRTNLKLLCPNCHSQTPTWKGRNSKKKKISDELFCQALRNNLSIHAALKELNLVAKGKNYDRAKRLIKTYQIEIKTEYE